MIEVDRQSDALTTTDACLAYEQIKQRIITTSMSPGTVVLEALLMKELGLGRTPVREALRMLQGERLITVVPRQGTYVSPVAINDAQAIQEVRLEIDPLCARLAAERSTDSTSREIEMLIARLAGQQLTSDARRFLDLDREVHFLLAKAAQNVFLYAEFEKMYNLSQRIWHLYSDRLQVCHLSNASLEQTLRAVEQGDPERAMVEMRRHLIQSHELLRQLM